MRARVVFRAALPPRFMVFRIVRPGRKTACLESLR